MNRIVFDASMAVAVVLIGTGAGLIAGLGVGVLAGGCALGVATAFGAYVGGGVR